MPSLLVEHREFAKLMGIVDPGRSRDIGISIQHRHDEACIRIKDFPLKR